MPLPEPRSGLVIGYAYLWHEEYLDGTEEGRKDWPCAVVLAVRQEDGDIVTTVAPITHAAPGDPHDAIELPASARGEAAAGRWRAAAREKSLIPATVDPFSWVNILGGRV